MVDLGVFILFNIYFPNTGMVCLFLPDPTWADTAHRVIIGSSIKCGSKKNCLRSFLATSAMAGPIPAQSPASIMGLALCFSEPTLLRKVVVVGDFNVIRTELDAETIDVRLPDPGQPSSIQLNSAHVLCVLPTPRSLRNHAASRKSALGLKVSSHLASSTLSACCIQRSGNILMLSTNEPHVSQVGSTHLSQLI